MGCYVSRCRSSKRCGRVDFVSWLTLSGTTVSMISLRLGSLSRSISLVRNRWRTPVIASMCTAQSDPPQPVAPGPVESSIRQKVSGSGFKFQCLGKTDVFCVIRCQLSSLLTPVELTITNDSWQHRHHAPMRAQGGGNGETRRFTVPSPRLCPLLSKHLLMRRDLPGCILADFTVTVVSEVFQGKVSSNRTLQNLGVCQ